MPKRRYFYVYDELRTTNSDTATMKFKKLMSDFEKCLSSSEPKEIDTHTLKTANKEYPSDVVNKKFSIKDDKLKDAISMDNSLFFRFMQIAKEFESILLELGLPVDVNASYVKKCESLDNYSHDEICQINADGRLYFSLQKCIDVEMTTFDPEEKAKIKAAIDGLKCMEEGRQRIINGSPEFACVAFLQAAIHLKTLALLKNEKEKLVGRSQISSGRSNTAINENTGRPSLRKYLGEPIQKEIDNYLHRHSCATDNQVFRHVVQKFNKETVGEFISDLELKNKKLTISTLKSWKQKKFIKTK